MMDHNICRAIYRERESFLAKLTFAHENLQSWWRNCAPKLSKSHDGRWIKLIHLAREILLQPFWPLCDLASSLENCQQTFACLVTFFCVYGMRSHHQDDLCSLFWCWVSREKPPEEEHSSQQHQYQARELPLMMAQKGSIIFKRKLQLLIL